MPYQRTGSVQGTGNIAVEAHCRSIRACPVVQRRELLHRVSFVRLTILPTNRGWARRVPTGELNGRVGVLPILWRVLRQQTVKVQRRKGQA